MGGKWKKHKAAAAGTGVPNGDAAQHQQPAQAAPVATVIGNGMVAAQLNSAAVAAPIGKLSTLSIAVPGSVIEHAPTPEVAAAVAAQIARAAAIFGVDEVVVYNDGAPGPSSPSTPPTVSIATATLARLLQYLETPGHLRGALFPGSVAYSELRAAEALCPSLQAPHHIHTHEEWQAYREGVVMRSEPGMGSFVDIGYDRNAYVTADLPISRRVTLNVGPAPHIEFVPAFSETMLKAQVASPSEARHHHQSWGYSVRVATSLSRAIKDAPVPKGYDLLVGTSKEGVEREVAELVLPRYKHALVLFGGVKGLEESFEEDEALAQSGKGPSDICSLYLNCCPKQGVVSMRTEDAVTTCLAYLHASMLQYGQR